MNKKSVRRLICLVLAFTLCFSPMMTASAESEKKEASYVADCPYIYIHGFMGTNVYENPSDPDSDVVFPPSGDEIKTAVKKGIPAILRVLFTHDWTTFGNDAVDICNILFEDSFLAPDGTASDGSGVRFTYPQKSSITKTSKLSFKYDWRLDPIQTAADLDKFINYVLDASGSEQVVVECHSYGGVILSTYAKLYGASKLKSCVFNSTAVYGETYNGELFTGNMIFDAKALTEYLKSAFDYNEKEDFFNGLFAVLYYTGITNLACKLVNYIIKKVGMKKLTEGIIPMFGGWLSIWSMIPDEYIDDAYKFVFDFTWGDDPTDRTGLQDKINDYNTRIRPYKTDTLKMINEESNMYVLSRYGYCAMFMTPSWDNESDNTIDVKYSSFGATVAKHGETLPAEYIKKADAKYISPSGNIDASTCLFPEQTWFIRHYTHSVGGNDLDEMIMTLLYSDGQATVDTYEEYPRFLYYNEDTDHFEIDK